jgi:hypothetical protein
VDTLERPPDLDVLKRALGETVLLELIEDAGALHAVTVDRKHARLHRLGPVTEVGAATTALRFAVGRLASAAVSGPSRDAAHELAHESASILDRFLLAPVLGQIGDRPLLIVPAGVLHGIPWAALPMCRRRPITVSPSAGLWLAMAQKASEAPRATRTVLVGGPGPAQAPGEVADLRALYPSATALSGADATTTAFCRAVAGADLVHVAAHGTFRSDNPLFSSLRLFDGPVTVYDLEKLEPPRRVVLSACEGGLSAVAGGEELMGLSAALLSLGTETLVASVTAVNDEATRTLMVELHRRLVAGSSPAQALAYGRSVFADDDRAQLATSGFACFGAGVPQAGPRVRSG